MLGGEGRKDFGEAAALAQLFHSAPTGDCTRTSLLLNRCLKKNRPENERQEIKMQKKMDAQQETTLLGLPDELLLAVLRFVSMGDIVMGVAPSCLALHRLSQDRSLSPRFAKGPKLRAAGSECDSMTYRYASLRRREFALALAHPPWHVIAVLPIALCGWLFDGGVCLMLCMFFIDMTAFMLGRKLAIVGEIVNAVAALCVVNTLVIILADCCSGDATLSRIALECAIVMPICVRAVSQRRRLKRRARKARADVEAWVSAVRSALTAWRGASSHASDVLALRPADLDYVV
jgi:hypothetical protein